MEQEKNTRKKDFKKIITIDEARRKREDSIVQIRKQKREEKLRRRRVENITGITDSVTDENFSPYRPIDPQTSARLERLPQMVEALLSPDPNIQLEATQQFRKLLSIERNPPIQQVIDTGVVPQLVTFLEAHEYPNLQFEAAWALTNIASGTSDNTRVVVEHNAIPLFVQLLQCESDDVREQAVWALGNIAGDSPEYRDRVLECDALSYLLLQLGEGSKLSMRRNATWTLSNFCRGKPQPDFEYVRPALPVLAQLLYFQDEEVLTDACWALSYLSDGTNDKIQAVLETGVCARLVELLMHTNPSVQTPALRTIGNIVTGDDLQTQVVINCSALQCLLSLLDSPKKGIRKEACWTISNITAGNRDQIQFVIDANLIPPLIELLEQGQFDIRKEAAWAISNATSGGTDEQILYLVNRGCVPPLCDLLGCEDSKIIMVALEGLENILKVGERHRNDTGGSNAMAAVIDAAGGIDKIEQLQLHNNQELYERAVSIIERYFGVEGNDESAVPAANEQQYTFGYGGGSGGFNFSGGFQ